MKTKKKLIKIVSFMRCQRRRYEVSFSKFFLNNFQEMRNHAETNGFISLCGKMFSSLLGDDFTLTINDLNKF